MRRSGVWRRGWRGWWPSGRGRGGVCVDGGEYDARVAAVEPDCASAGRKPDPEPVAAIRARRASLPDHLREHLLTDDRAREERTPERRHVRGGRVDAAVAASDHRQVED